MTEITAQIEDIDNLKVSDKWKRRFKLYEILNARQVSRNEFIKSDTFKQFTWREKLSISSNLWAFSGGFIYYFIKRMHYKGAAILSLTMLWSTLLSIIDFFSGFTIPNNMYWFPPSLICSMFASLDFYRKTISNELMWQSWPNYFSDKKTVIMITIASVMLYVGSIAYEYNHEYFTNAALNSNDAVRITCGMNNLYILQEEIDMFGESALCDTLVP